MATPSKCPLGPTHKWTHSRDTTLQSRPMPGVIRLTKRGVYECACGAFKHGEPANPSVFG